MNTSPLSGRESKRRRLDVERQHKFPLAMFDLIPPELQLQVLAYHNPSEIIQLMRVSSEFRNRVRELAHIQHADTDEVDVESFADVLDSALCPLVTKHGKKCPGVTLAESIFKVDPEQKSREFIKCSSLCMSMYRRFLGIPAFEIIKKSTLPHIYVKLGRKRIVKAGVSINVSHFVFKVPGLGHNLHQIDDVLYPDRFPSVNHVTEQIARLRRAFRNRSGVFSDIPPAANPRIANFILVAALIEYIPGITMSASVVFLNSLPDYIGHNKKRSFLVEVDGVMFPFWAKEFNRVHPLRWEGEVDNAQLKYMYLPPSGKLFGAEALGNSIYLQDRFPEFVSPGLFHNEDDDEYDPE